MKWNKTAVTRIIPYTITRLKNIHTKDDSQIQIVTEVQCSRAGMLFNNAPGMIGTSMNKSEFISAENSEIESCEEFKRRGFFL